jgi:Tfp pilus assembly protein PilX
MRTPSLRNERGIALVVAVVALVVIGAIVAGTFFVSTVEQRSAQNVIVAAAAQQAAEGGLEDAVANIKGEDYIYGVADSSAYASNVTPSGWSTSTSYTVWVFPVNSSTWLIKSVGTSNGSTATLAEVVKAAVTNTPATSPLIVSSPVTFNGNSFQINGNNANPPVSTGCPATPVPAQVYAVRSATGTGMTNGDRDNVLGVTGMNANAGEGSAVANDPTVNPLMSTIFGTGGSYDQFRAAATLTYAPATYTQRQPSTTVVGGVTKCNYADNANWGEPKTTVPQCNSYFPIVLGTSTIGNPFKITGVRGQGVLLADGDLELTGGFEWYGLILVKGSFKITGTGAKVFGSVIAQNGATVDDNTISGNTQITYSTCAISRALNGVAYLRPASTRAWTQLY